MAVADITDHKMHEWTRGKVARDARTVIYYKIRNIPYAVIPELNDPEQYIRILNFNRGSCTPKHFLLCYLYQKIGLEVLYAVYPSRWADFQNIYPPELQELSQAMVAGYHLTCKVGIVGKLVLVGTTIDPALQKLSLSVRKTRDGFSDPLLAMNPCGEEQLYHPPEACLTQPRMTSGKSPAFYTALNSWLETVRR